MARLAIRTGDFRLSFKLIEKLRLRNLEFEVIDITKPIANESISINFATRTNKFNLDDNFNIYHLNTSTGEYHVIKDGSEDQPDHTYHYPNNEIKALFKDN